MPFVAKERFGLTFAMDSQNRNLLVPERGDGGMI